jgi:AcrR family transcriptional regulator
MRSIASQPDHVSPKSLQRRERLLAEAKQLFGERDYEEVSVDEIAERAGVSHGLAFQHYGSKRGLLVAVVDSVLDEFRVRVMTVDPALPPQERLRTSLESYIGWAAEEPAGYRTLMGDVVPFAEVRERIEAMRWEGVEAMALAAGLDPTREDVRIGLRGWIGFFDRALLTWLETKDVSSDRLIEIITAAFMATVGALYES